MLSYLDPVIFPNRCEVLEIVPSQRYVFPIFKNGSSSLHSTYKQTISQSAIAQLTEIDVFVRNPEERFLSGVQTYINDLAAADPAIDRYTVLQFINRYMFLNRHFVPQFHWLVNLKRFTDAKVRLLPLSDLSTITTVNANHHTIDADVTKLLDNPKIQFYLSIDKVLTERLIYQTVDFQTIVKNVGPEVYKEVIEYSKSICGVLD